MNLIDDILDSVISGKRLSDSDALLLLTQADLITLGVAADKIRKIKHPENIVTYIVDRNINYTNTCTASCLFCAFYRPPGDNEGYLLSLEELDKKIEETITLGGNQILLQGGLHPDLTIDWYEDLLRHIKKKHGICIHGFSGPEIVNIAELSGLDIRTTIERLKQAGLDSIPGGEQRFL
jgi:cyclic dehypoxanthinyl futalosine synthase